MLINRTLDADERVGPTICVNDTGIIPPGRIDPTTLVIPGLPIEGTKGETGTAPVVASGAEFLAPPVTSIPDIIAPASEVPPPPPTSTKRLDAKNFPDPPAPGSVTVPLTIDNVEYLLAQSGLTARFDVIKKRAEFRWRDGAIASINDIVSLAHVNRLNGTGWVLEFIHDVAMRHPVNPVAEWINRKPWDGVDRLVAIYDTVQVADDYPSYLKPWLLYRWLLSATAAATLQGRRFNCRGVLTLQGPQGIGKTTWIANLLPPGALRDDCIKRDHHMDGANKDSILSAISHWLVEIGELDSSFKKDVARLKGFLTNDCDKIRKPYGKSEVEYPRRTVFAATVNDEAFLVDPSGNSRFWTISVTALDYNHDIDMQQVFAQLQVDLDGGAQWWLDPNEDQALARYNLRHRSVSAIAEKIQDFIAMDALESGQGTYMTPTELLRMIGVNNPSNSQCKECAATLRELIGTPRRVQGRMQWRVPILEGAMRKPEPMSPDRF